jgi:WD40 repeat protein
MTDGTIETTVAGGEIQGVVGAGTVVIENFTIYNRASEEPDTAAVGDESIAPCPYPGLAYFGPNDSALFFGRDAAIGRLTTAVSEQSFTALIGSSGSGKSSVVLAGLAPRLHGLGGWRFGHFRIGNELEHNPFLALARALVPLFMISADDLDRLANTKKLAALLRSGELTLGDVFADSRGRDKGGRILLIADQFEETFTLVEDEVVRHRFIDVLLAGFPEPSSVADRDISLILTMRADFFGHALLYRPLTDALQGHVENLGPMSRAELRLAIEKPAENAKVSFEPGLVETLLDDVESKPGSLPLLQFALREIWGLQEKRKITRKSYDAIGGVQGALARRAEAIFAEMTADGTNARMAADFQRLFTRLVTPGEGQEDTRRIVERRELGDEVWSLAQRLAGEANRLVVTSAPDPSRETAEVVHEALIRNWPTLAGWINRDRAFLSWLRQIKSNVELWSADPSDDGPLLRGGMLAQARDWLARRREDLSPAEQGYIEASLALRRRAEEEQENARQAEIRRQQELAQAAVKVANEQRWRARISLVGVIVALLLAAFGGWKTLEAYTAKKQADENAIHAVAAAKQAQVERDKAHIQLLAMQARREVTDATSADDIERAGALALASMAKSTGLSEADAIEAARAALILLPLGVLSHGSWVWSLAVAPDGRLASGGEDGTIKLWPKEGTGAPAVLSHGSSVRSLAVLPDGRLASGGEDGTIKLWPKEGTGAPAVLSHGGQLWSLAVLPDGRLASGGDHDRIELWPKEGTGAPVALSQGVGWIMSLVVLADGRLASGGADGTIKLWPKEGTGAPVVLSQGSPVESLEVLADGRLASGGSDGTIKLWPKEGTGEPVVLSQGSEVWSLAVLGDGRLASGSSPIKLWPKESTGAPVVLSQDNSRFLSLKVLPDGRLASGGYGTIKLWPKEGKGEPAVLSQGSSWVRSLAVLPDGRLASGDDDGTIKLWPKGGTGEPVVLSHGSPVYSLAVLPDGRLASGGYGTIKLWPKEGRGEPVILSQGSPVLSLAVLADGRLASGGYDGTIKLWPKEGTGEPVVLSQGNPVEALAVLADGRLASGDYDGKIKLWLVDEQKLIATLCLRAGRNLSKSEWARYIGSDTPRQPSCGALGLPSNWRTPD